jgi:hypothetical protein
MNQCHYLIDNLKSEYESNINKTEYKNPFTFDTIMFNQFPKTIRKSKSPFSGIFIWNQNDGNKYFLNLNRNMQ